MISTVEVKVCAASPQKPLHPWVAFQGSPSSVRIVDVPKKIGLWDITGVQVQVLYPDNQSIVKDAVRTGSVWVATIEGCETAGKVIQGYQITASGKDENDNPVEGYVLGCGDVFVMEVSNDIKALVGKAAVRYLEDLPTTPVEGDMYLANGTMKFFTGSEWVDFGGSTEGLVTEEEFEEYKGQVSASISAIDSSLSVLSASVSSLASSVTSLSLTKRDYTDRTWKYTKTTDPVMYGVKKFFVTRDEDGQQSHSYDLMDFDETNKVWSEYEAPITIKAYSPSLYAVIDENNPHTFEYDDEEYNGWEFYRLNDSDTSFTVSGGGANIEYHINLTRRSDDSFAMESGVSEKRDYDDITWDYPMEQDPARFGIERFTVDFQGHVWNLNKFVQLNSITKKWYSEGDSLGDRFTITTDDGRHYDLNDLTLSETYPFTRTGDGNVRWDIETSTMAYRVNAIRRQGGKLAIYEQDIDNPDQRMLNFGQESGSGIVICDNVSARTQAFVQIDDVMLTGNNYSSSRSTRLMKRGESSPHLKVNGEAIAFVNEVEAVSADVSTMASSITSLESNVSDVAASISTMASSITSIDGSVSAMASSMANIGANVSAIGGSVSALASSMATKRDFFDLVYPNFDDNINDGFGMGFAYSFEGGIGSILNFNGTEYTNGELCATWGWHGQILVAMPNQSTIWLFDKYDNLKHIISLNEFKKTTQWLDYVSPAQDDMIIDALEVPRIVYLYLRTALDGRDKNTKIVLENQLSAYATTSALGSVSASVSAMASTVEANTSAISANTSAISAITSSLSNYATTSALDVVSASVSTMASSISTLESSVSALASSVSSLASSMNGKRDYLDLGYSYTSTSTSTVTVSVPFSADKMIGSTASETNAYRSSITLVYDGGYGETYTATYVPGQMETDGYWECESGNYITWEDQGNGYEFFIDEYINMGKPNDGDTTWVGGNIDYEEQSLTLTMPTVTTSTRPFYSASMSSSAYQEGLVFNYYGFDYSYPWNGEVTWGDFDGTDQFMFRNVGIGCPPDGWIYDWKTTYDTAVPEPINITLKLPSMTSTVTVSDTLALTGSVSSMLSAYATTSAVNASVSALSSSISAIASSLNVSGIGCSTVTMSGVYANSSSFAYDVVIQPTA